MRQLPVPVVELHLSPILSPNRQSTPVSDTENTQHTLHTASSSEQSHLSILPSLQIDLPDVTNTTLYPLASKPTPTPLKRFIFHLDGKPSLFEEIPANVSRKRSAIWEDDRAHKHPEIQESTSSVAMDTSDIPDSPRSALPSPISDVDTSEPWNDPPFHSLIDMYTTLPDTIQTYFMFQLLKRSPKNVLRLAHSAAIHSLRIDILTSLPSHLAHQILSYLDIRSLCRATLVSHAWKTMIDHASSVWRDKIREHNYSLSDAEYASLDTHDMCKRIVRRHTILRRNWGRGRYERMVLEGHGNAAITCLQFDAEKIITGSDDGSIHVYDIVTGDPIQVLHGHEGGVWALQYVNNTLVTGSTDRTVRVWDIHTGLCRYVFRGHSSTVRCLKIVMPTNVNPDGAPIMEPLQPLIVSGSRDTTIRVWNLPDLSTPPVQDEDALSLYYLKYAALAEHENSVRDLAAYGNILVSGSYDCSVIIWDLEKGKKKFLLRGHSLKVYSVVIDHKNRHCISGSLDASVRVWGLDDGECKMVLQGHTSLVGLLGLVDNYLVSAAADTTLRVWDTRTGDRLHIMAGRNGHQATITTFQHDDQKIISGSEGGVKVWDIKTGELLYDIIENVNTVWRVCFDERRCVAAVKNDDVTQIVVLDFGVYGMEE